MFGYKLMLWQAGIHAAAFVFVHLSVRKQNVTKDWMYFDETQTVITTTDLILESTWFKLATTANHFLKENEQIQ